MTTGAGANERPLRMALQIDDRSGPASVAMLIEAGADPNRPKSSGAPIFYAGTGNGSPVETLALLLKHEADLRAASTQGETILNYAATVRNWKAAAFLLENGADSAHGRSFKGLTFAELVDEAVRQQAERDGGAHHNRRHRAVGHPRQPRVQPHGASVTHGSTPRRVGQRAWAALVPRPAVRAHHHSA